MNITAIHIIEDNKMRRQMSKKARLFCLISILCFAALLLSVSAYLFTSSLDKRFISYPNRLPGYYLPISMAFQRLGFEWNETESKYVKGGTKVWLIVSDVNGKNVIGVEYSLSSEENVNSSVPALGKHINSLPIPNEATISILHDETAYYWSREYGRNIQFYFLKFNKDNICISSKVVVFEKEK